MAKHTELPPVVGDHAPEAAIPHLPTALPPSPVAPPTTEVELPQHALDVVELIPTVGVGHLPDFFF
jgi:hypothetical protein